MPEVSLSARERPSAGAAPPAPPEEENGNGLTWFRSLPLVRELPPWAVSVMAHSLVLVLLGFCTYTLQVDSSSAVAIETRIVPEREIVEFPRELDMQEDPSPTLNVIAGTGVPADQVGSAPAIAHARVDRTQLPEAELHVNLAPIDLPGREILGRDIRFGLQGETGAIVGDYGQALDRLTQEILRLLRESGKVLVVWLFDESRSMTDDQQEIKNRFQRVYEELGLAKEASGKALVTSIVSFGKEIHYHTAEPTSDVDAIRAAIDKIPVDDTGTENMCQALTHVIQQHRPLFTRGGYRLAVVVITDESGDDGDGELLEQGLETARRSKGPIYVVGREAVFGSPNAYITWTNPETGLGYWRPIRRGPETAFVEQLQFDGFERRYDAHASGFGSYEQARLVRDTGGILFLLPHEEAALVVPDRRKYADLDMQEYIPVLDSRGKYLQQRSTSKFRSTIAEVIDVLDPKQITVPVRFSIQPTPFKVESQAAIKKALEVTAVLKMAHERLEAVKPLRAHETSRRWRANYDLILGQVMAYRLHLFEYARHLHQFTRDMPKPKDEKSNRWDIGTVKELCPMDETLKLTGVTEEQLHSFVEASTAQLQFVISEHPRTPWAARAQWELDRGFSVRLHEAFYDPKYDLPLGFELPNL